MHLYLLRLDANHTILLWSKNYKCLGTNHGLKVARSLGSREP
uniref:BC005705 protein n=1 Tax=Mus musculus TaxID=10090 RepID=Q99JT4_MOUSE|nr:BC005705 protein [Mus musculus]